MPDTSLGPLIIAPFVFLGVGLLFVILSIRAWRTSRAQATWPSVPGVVRSAAVHRAGFDRERDNYHPRIAYDYTVDGRQFAGEWTGIAGGQGYLTRRGAEKLAAQFPPGATVPLHYDPADPSRSTLRRGKACCATVFMAALGALCTLIGAGMLWLFLAVG